MLSYGRWFFVGMIINNMMNDPAVDATAYVFMWAIIGLLVSTARLINKQKENATTTD